MLVIISFYRLSEQKVHLKSGDYMRDGVESKEILWYAARHCL